MHVVFLSLLRNIECLYIFENVPWQEYFNMVPDIKCAEWWPDWEELMPKKYNGWQRHLETEREVAEPSNAYI